MTTQSRLALTVSALATAALIFAGSMTPAAAATPIPKSGIYCSIKGKAASKEAQQVAVDFCKVQTSVKGILSADALESLKTKKQINKAFPKGTRFTVYSKTWRPSVLPRSGTILIGAQYPKKKAKPYLALMLHPEGGGWKLEQTYTVTVDK